MANSKNHTHCTPEELYLKMLEIGSKCISCGVTYSDLKKELCDCNLIKETENDTTIRILFLESFYDNSNSDSKTCKCPEAHSQLEKTDSKSYFEQNDKYYEYPHLDNCLYFLNNTALMNLFRMRDAEKNKKALKRTQCISFASLGAAILILLANIIGLSSGNNLDELKAIKTQLAKINTELKSQTTQITNTATNSDILNETLDSNKVELKQIKEIENTLNSINWKLLKIKQDIVNEESQ